ncbi:MAG: HlyD family efflux transporter periplasmic adaptor subunit [Deltaproteobacteria bacterium]|nr:HlyD family efflux transporter periplasmic adaptor subunit [Deltaproteobacteria bacterium]
MKNGHVCLGLHGKKWGWLLIFVAVCGGLAIYFLLNLNPSFENQPSFSAYSSAKNNISCLGRLLPGGRIFQVAAPTRAVVKELLVHRGQWVEQGELLARLRDYPRETAALHLAEKEVAVAVSLLDLVRAGEKAATIEAQQAAIARQEAILSQEETQYERSRQLYEKKILSAKDFDEALTRRNTARESLLLERHKLVSIRDIRKEDLALAANKVEVAKAALRVALENVELNVIRAPVSGRVLELHAFPGEAVPEQGLLELGNGREMLVEAEVYVGDIGRVRIGAPAVISGDAFHGSISGHVLEIVPMVTRGEVLPSDPLAFSDLRIVKVWIQLDDSNAVANLGNHQVSVVIKP